jgi:hypothetical protein
VSELLGPKWGLAQHERIISIAADDQETTEEYRLAGQIIFRSDLQAKFLMVRFPNPIDEMKQISQTFPNLSPL